MTIALTRRIFVRRPRMVLLSRRLARKAPLSPQAEGPLSGVSDPLRVLLSVLTVVTISRVHQHYPVLEKFRPALLLVIVAVAYAYLNPRFLTNANVLKFWPMRLVAVLAVLACLSTAFGISLGAAALFILDFYAKTVAYAFLIAVSIRHIRDLFTFVWAYVISCGILGYFSIFVFGISKGNSYVTRLNNLYTYDSNDLGVVMMVGLPLTLLLLTVERGLKRWSLLVILIAIATTMARSGSRGGFLGFVAVGVAALLMVKGVSVTRRITVFVVAVTALVLGAPPGYWEQMQTILKPKQDYNYTDIDGRKAVMERGIGYMKQYPVFGLGIAQFSRAECTISPKLSGLRHNGPVKCTAPHNSYLEAGAELGYPGLLVWISLVIGGIVAPVRLRRRLPIAWKRGAQAERFLYGATSFFPLAMIGFAVTAFFVSFAWMDPIYFLAAMNTGLYVAVRQQAAKPALGRRGGNLPGPIPTALIARWRNRQRAWRTARQIPASTPG